MSPSSSSIGTGTPQDDNENHPCAQDHWPSRTLGADAAPARPVDDVPAEATEPSAAQPSPPAERERIKPDFPEGPNVAPSPWEDEAARGRA